MTCLPRAARAKTGNARWCGASMRHVPGLPTPAPAHGFSRRPAAHAALLVICALAPAACAPSAADTTDQWRAIGVTATPVEFGAERVGRLRFRGGVELTSDSA